MMTACAPDTELVGEGGPPDGSRAAGAAGAVLVDPAPGTTGVPLNLAAVLVRFPTTVAVPAGALTLTSAVQTALVGVPDPVDCVEQGAGACFRLPVDGPLAPTATYVVSLAGGVVDGDGRPVAAGPVGQFATAAEADLTAPGISGLTVGPSGPCVLASFQTDEPAAAMLVLRGAGGERQIAAGAGTTSFSVAASVAAFGAGAEVQVIARVADLAGNVAETASVSLTVPDGLVPVAITEVLSNAAGPEPAQEFIELRNLGPDVVDVGGLAVEDAKGADVLPSFAIEPGAFALVVPSGFDAASAVDTPPKAGTALIRVDARLGADGLTNGGEAVRLRTATGTVISGYGGGVDVSATKWAGKSVHRVPEDACDQPASWTRLPAAATPGWGAP
ncbi:MAG: lamin tail domain-containing protein [Verrucomicrobiota bacterium]